ncbi:MAG: polyprenyl synthetase family protein [Gemmatimonadota bacterium]
MSEAVATEGDRLLADARILTDAELARVAARLRGEVGGTLGEALAYAVGTLGKGVRPALVIAAYRTAGGRSDAIAGVAAAVELVHTYSLVHDDLPCMDDDPQRRGRPTTHVAFDVPTATRVGFLLVPVAVEVLTDALARLDVDVARAGRIASVLLRASGIGGMVGGQWLDLAAEGQALDLAALQNVHRRKTGALIEAACVIGALAGGAPDPLVAVLSEFGRTVGLAFQIADDVLDATATSAQLGKTAGRDATMAKSTYVSILGVEGARREAFRLADLALTSLERGRVDAPSLASLASYIVHRQS